MPFQDTKSATNPPQAHDWTGYGRTDQELAQGPKAGYETLANFRQSGEQYGELYGAAQVEQGIATGSSSGPEQWIKGASKVRKAVLKARSLRARMGARQRVQTRQARKVSASARVKALKERLTWLQDDKRPGLQQQARDARDAVAVLRVELARLPLVKRAEFFHANVVAGIGTAVVAYDIVVLRAALEHAGFGLEGATLTYAAIATPLAIMAINTVLGVLAGAIALHVPSRARLQLAVVSIISGGAALTVTFILLALFRAEATSGHNGLLHALSIGAKHPQGPVLVPWWFAPLQFAGSIAAIASVAMYTTGKDGRELRGRISDEEKKVKELERQHTATDAQIERTHNEIEVATVAIQEVDVDAEAAQIEIQTADETLRSELDAEDGLQEAVIGSYRSSYTYFAKIFRNGKVWRVALPTIPRRFNRFYTPPPGDREMAATPPSPGEHAQNGKDKLSPEELQGLAGSQ